MNFRLKPFVFAAMLLSADAVYGQVKLDPATEKLSHDIFKQLIEINTTDSVGSVTAAAEAMRARLLDAGFPAADLVLDGPNDRKKNLVARYRGRLEAS